MVSDVVIAGYLKEKKSRDKFRYIETYSKRGFGEEVIPFLIPLLYWTRDKDNILNRMKEKALIIIKGRIENDNDIGLYVLVESIHLTNGNVD